MEKHSILSQVTLLLALEVALLFCLGVAYGIFYMIYTSLPGGFQSSGDLQLWNISFAVVGGLMALFLALSAILPWRLLVGVSILFLEGVVLFVVLSLFISA